MNKNKNRQFLKGFALGAVVAFVASVILIGASVDKAFAHNQDNNSYFGCAVLRNELPGNDNEWSVDHSWWDGLYPNLATGRCMYHNIYNGNLHGCLRMSWFYPGQPGQYFDATGVDVTDPCWFNAH